MGMKILDYIKLFHKPSTQEHLRLLQLHVAEDMFLLLCVYTCTYGYVYHTYMITYIHSGRYFIHNYNSWSSDIHQSNWDVWWFKSHLVSQKCSFSFKQVVYTFISIMFNVNPNLANHYIFPTCSYNHFD